MKRPTFLTFWLLLITTYITIGLIANLEDYLGVRKALHLVPQWVSLLYVFLAIPNLMGVYMLWRWKILGFKLILVVLTINSFLDNFYKFHLESEYVVSFLNKLGTGETGFTFKLSLTAIQIFIGIGILYLAMKPAWKQFK